MTRGTSTLDVVERGRNGRLFLGQQDSYDVRTLRDGSLVPPKARWRWRLTLQRRAAELAMLGIPYVFYIVPDAPSVYPEDLPESLRGDPGGDPNGGDGPLGARLVAELQDIPNLTVVYPLDDMLEAKGGLPLYRKTDTHWSGFGAYVAYRAFCRAVAPLVPIDVLSSTDVRYAITREFGDLGSLLEPEEPGWNAAMRIDSRQVQRTHMAQGPDRMNTQSFRYEGRYEGRCEGPSKVNVLFLRDSFMTEQSPLMAMSFAGTEMVGTTSRLFIDHVKASRPDLVVTEICERRLTEWESDHQSDGFEDLFGTDWTSDLGRRVLSVEMALRQGQVAAAATAAVPLLDLPAAEISPGHAAVLARACLGGQQVAAAHRLVGRALEDAPARPSLLCLAAQVAFNMDDGQRALHLAAAAREVAPWNGFTHELLAYMLLVFQRVPEALDAFHQAAPRILDHPNLFLLGSTASEQCGDIDAARVSMRRAADLWPANEAFQSRLAALDARLDSSSGGSLAPDQPIRSRSLQLEDTLP